jgi:hypothetical protein
VETRVTGLRPVDERDVRGLELLNDVEGAEEMRAFSIGDLIE